MALVVNDLHSGGVVDEAQLSPVFYITNGGLIQGDYFLSLWTSLAAG